MAVLLRYDLPEWIVPYAFSASEQKNLQADAVQVQKDQ